MDNKDKEIIQLFQCEDIRFKEEDFAQTFTEDVNVRLFFINENRAFTDGENIIIDPAINDLFCDDIALRKTEDYLKMDHHISSDRWYALKMITRAINLHESLHIIYSNFPGVASRKEVNTKSKKMLIGMISNIIEDAFIDAVGCSIYDNLEKYIVWFRVLTAFRSTHNEGTVEKVFSNHHYKENENKDIIRLKKLLEYMVYKLVYPMFSYSEPEEDIKEYVEITLPIFEKAVICGDADKRDAYAVEIFLLIKKLLPKDEEVDFTELNKLLSGMETHTISVASINKKVKKGKSVTLTKRAFTNFIGEAFETSHINNLIKEEIKKFEKEKEQVISIVQYSGKQISLYGNRFDGAAIHENVEIKIINPKINLNLKRAYDNIVKSYRLNINSYSMRFSKLLKERFDKKDDKQIFGHGVSSKNFSDTKKRYWYRKVEGIRVPNISIMFLIDGSGSMAGNRREAAIISSVILHEVLKKNNIPHSIVEHRAIYGEPLLIHNILVDFKARNEEKYNLLTLEAIEGTREGLSLLWAEKYIKDNTISDLKLIVMISDGIPAHEISDNDIYLPPVSTKDTANAVRKIIKRGTKIVAIALDEPGRDDCYEMLRKMYPAVVSCNDLSKLTGQLLSLISRELEV